MKTLMDNNRYKNIRHISQINCFKCGRHGHFASQYFNKMNHSSQRAIKAKVTILDRSCSTKKKANNLISLMESKSTKDPSSTTLKSTRLAGPNDKEQEEVLETYNKLLRKKIKYEKACKKALDSLDKKDKELSALKVSLKKNKSFINQHQNDLSMKCEIIQKKYIDMVVE